MQAKLAAALESSADSVYISDAEGRLVDFNEAFVKCHRFQNKAECFKTLVEYPTILDAFLPDGSLMPLDNWAVSRALRGESGTNEVYHLRRKDTGEEWIGSYSFAPIRDSGGAIIGSVVVGRDITEQRRAEVAEREREAQKLTSLQLMAGGVAHDFNNLLAAVLGNASLAEAWLPADSFEATLVRRAPLALASVVPEILDALRSRIPPQIRVSLQLQADAPAVSADRGGLQQILQNLVINAVEAIGQKTGEITIRTERQVVDAAFARECPEAASLKPGAYVRIEVQDTGEGMDATTKAKVFDPFFSTKFTGRGLGLPVVSGVVRGHGGAVWLSSTPGHGSTLVVLLPAAAAVATVTETATPLEYLRGSAGVLVVDDDPLVREVIKDSLELLGYQVLTADSGAQAVATVRDRHADIALVILDWTMPAMDGYQTLEAIRKISADVKILISSGYGEQSALTRFKGQNVVGFLPKPFKVTSIAAKVRDALR
jgi:signal transduction histidine kinase/CheY-like chemotaxis protein